METTIKRICVNCKKTAGRCVGSMFIIRNISRKYKHHKNKIYNIFEQTKQNEEFKYIFYQKGKLPLEIVDYVMEFVDVRERCCKCKKIFDNEFYTFCNLCDRTLCHDCKNIIIPLNNDCYFCTYGSCFHSKSLECCDKCYDDNPCVMCQNIVMIHN